MRTQKDAKKKVLITGATGVLGRAVSRAFRSSEDAWDVLCVGLKRAKGEIMRVDLTDFDATTKLVEAFAPHVIVHCAGIRGVDSKDAWRLNVEVTQHLARLTRIHTAWLLITSTDEVFDGTNPPYTEGATMNPLTAFGRQKQQAGMLAREADWGCGSLRLGSLYGDVEDLAESDVSSVLKQLLESSKSGSEVVLDDWRVLYPTFVNDVAKIALALAEQKLQHCGLSGVWNCSGPQGFTKYGLGLALCKHFGLDASRVKANVPENKDQIPRDPKLDTTTLELMGLSTKTPFEQVLDETLRTWVEKDTTK